MLTVNDPDTSPASVEATRNESPRRRWTLEKDMPGASTLRRGLADMMEISQGNIAQSSLRDDLETNREQQEISKQLDGRRRSTVKNVARDRERIAGGARVRP